MRIFVKMVFQERFRLH